MSRNGAGSGGGGGGGGALVSLLIQSVEPPNSLPLAPQGCFGQDPDGQDWKVVV